MTTQPKQKLSQSESGFAAFLVTMVMVFVISLIVLGFAQIAQREQRQSLDRQLSTQAFYAAETGVNDAVAFVRASGAAIGVQTKTTCATPTNDGSIYDSMPNNSVLNASAGVSYTCLLIDPAPVTQQYKDVGDTSIVVPIQSANGDNITSLNFTWQPAPNQVENTAGCPANIAVNALPTPAGWTNCTFGLARMDLVSVDGTFSMQSLSQNTMTGFFMPNAGASGNQQFTPNSTAPSGNPLVYAASCLPGTNKCSETITGLNSPNYQMRLRFIYQSSALVQVSAQNSSGAALRITGDQIVVDATGKASDVLRRIQVHVPVFVSNVASDYAIQTTNSLCKQFIFEPTINAGQGVGIPGAGPDAQGVSITTDPDCHNFGF